ncbi:Protein of uncharacterised function (DUF1365) [Serratia liquefaciens]|nr:Protein of uncharacterised function (DUF1365) [Serratia liquefaciens]
MNSCLYQGVLRHRRLQPKAHHFVYRLFMAWLDLDELDKLPEAGIRRNRLAPLPGTTPIIRWARR